MKNKPGTRKVLFQIPVEVADNFRILSRTCHFDRDDFVTAVLSCAIQRYVDGRPYLFNADGSWSLPVDERVLEFASDGVTLVKTPLGNARVRTIDG